MLYNILIFLSSYSFADFWSTLAVAFLYQYIDSGKVNYTCMFLVLFPGNYVIFLHLFSNVFDFLVL